MSDASGRYADIVALAHGAQRPFRMLELLGAAAQRASDARVAQAGGAGIAARAARAGLYLDAALLVLEYMKDVGVSRAVKSGFSTVPCFTKAEISDLLCSCADELGIQDDEEMGRLVDDVLDRVLCSNFDRRWQWYRPVGGEKGKLGITCCRKEKAGYCLDQEWLLQFAKLVDFAALGGPATLDIRIYMVKMALDKKEFSTAVARLRELLSDTLGRCAYYAEKKVSVQKSLAEGESIIDVDELMAESEVYKKNSATCREFGNMFEQSEDDAAVAGGENVILEGKRLVSECYSAFLSLSRAIGELLDAVSEVCRTYKPVVNPTLFDAMGMLAPVLPTLPGEAYERLIDCFSLGMWAPAEGEGTSLDFMSLIAIPTSAREGRRERYKPVEDIVWDDPPDPAAEIEQRGKRAMEALTSWLRGRPGKKGQLSTYLSGDGFEFLSDPVFFDEILESSIVDGGLTLHRRGVVYMSREGHDYSFTDFMLELN